MPNTFGLMPITIAGGTPRKRIEDRSICAKCQCMWFEEVKVSMIDSTKLVIPGQTVPKLSETFILYRCVKCLELHEPQMATSASPGYKAHQEMVSQIDNIQLPVQISGDAEKKE